MFSFRKKAVFNLMLLEVQEGLGGRAQSNQKFKDINGLKILSIPATPGSQTRKGESKKEGNCPQSLQHPFSPLSLIGIGSLN